MMMDDDDDCSAGLAQASASSSFQPGDEPREDTPGFCFGDVTQVLVQKDASVHREWILVSQYM